MKKYENGVTIGVQTNTETKKWTNKIVWENFKWNETIMPLCACDERLFYVNTQKLIIHPLEVQILIVIVHCQKNFCVTKRKKMAEKLFDFIQFMKCETLLLLLLLLSHNFHFESLIRSRVKKSWIFCWMWAVQPFS